MQEMVLYDVQDLTPTNFTLKEKKTQPKLAGNKSYTRKTVEPSSVNSIPEVEQIVKDLEKKYFTDELADRVVEKMGESVSLDKNSAVQYNKKNKLINKTFPPYNYSQSEANELATRRAKREDVPNGSQKLISYHNQWYIVEKFSSTEQGYLIKETVKQSEYERKAKELKSYEREYTYANSVTEGIGIYGNARRGQNSHIAEASNGRSDIQLSSMAKIKYAGRASDGSPKRNNYESSRNLQNNEIEKRSCPTDFTCCGYG